MLNSFLPGYITTPCHCWHTSCPYFIEGIQGLGALWFRQQNSRNSRTLLLTDIDSFDRAVNEVIPGAVNWVRMDRCHTVFWKQSSSFEIIESERQYEKVERLIGFRALSILSQSTLLLLLVAHFGFSLKFKPQILSVKIF